MTDLAVLPKPHPRPLAAALPLLVLLAACAPGRNSGISSPDRDYVSVRLLNDAGDEVPVGNLARGKPAASSPSRPAHLRGAVSYGELYPLDGVVRGSRWEFVRGVRFSARELDAAGSAARNLSPQIVEYLKTQAPEIDPEAPRDRARHGRWRQDGEWHYQLVALRLTWGIERSTDGHAFRIVAPRGQVFATALELSGSEAHRARGADVGVALSAEFVNGMAQQRAAVFDGALRGVRPDAATVQGDAIVPAADVLLAADASPWITNNGENYTLHVDVTERPAAR